MQTKVWSAKFSKCWDHTSIIKSLKWKIHGPAIKQSSSTADLISKQEQKPYSTTAKQKENIQTVQRRIPWHQNKCLNILKVKLIGVNLMRAAKYLQLQYCEN